MTTENTNFWIIVFFMIENWGNPRWKNEKMEWESLVTFWTCEEFANNLSSKKEFCGQN